VAEGYATISLQHWTEALRFRPTGNRVTVGSVQTPRSGDQGSPSGQVRIYGWTWSDWTQVGSDLASDIPEVGEFPWEVDLSPPYV
jgi:hypothetical protein